MYYDIHQRKLIYEDTLQRVLMADFPVFLCLAVRSSGKRLFKIDSLIFAEIEEDFPELHIQRPFHKSYTRPWWDTDDKESRVSALQECIRLCEVKSGVCTVEPNNKICE